MKIIFLFFVTTFINNQLSYVESKLCIKIKKDVTTTFIPPIFGATFGGTLTTTPSNFNRVMTQRRDILVTTTVILITTTPSPYNRALTNRRELYKPPTTTDNQFQKVLTIRRDTLKQFKPTRSYRPPKVYTMTLPLTIGFSEVI